MEHSQRKNIREAQTIKELMKKLSPQNQSYILNTIEALLFAQQCRNGEQQSKRSGDKQFV